MRAFFILTYLMLGARSSAHSNSARPASDNSFDSSRIALQYLFISLAFSATDLI